MSEINYEEDLRIDHNALDIMCLTQPMRFMSYAKLAADAAAELDRAKERLDVVRAETDATVRKAAADAGEKVTEAVVSGRIIQNAVYMKANDDFLTKKHTLDILNAAVKAFQQRKDMIENLIRLAAQSYFATPAIPRDLDAEVKKRLQGRQKEEEEKGIEDTRSRIQRSRINRREGV